MQRKVCSFDENDMKTYSCRRGLITNRLVIQLKISQNLFVYDGHDPFLIKVCQKVKNKISKLDISFLLNEICQLCSNVAIFE